MIEKRDAFLSALDETIETHPDAKKTLAELGVRGLKRNFFSRQFVDLSTGRKELRSGMVLALALTFSNIWKEQLQAERRVGVVLPSGLGSLLVNLTLQILGKTPVNLNFTAGRAVNEKCLAKAGIQTVITAKPVVDKLTDFPWPEKTIDLVAERAHVRKPVVIANMIRAFFLSPTRLLAGFDSANKTARDEATILFSSGTTGDPKGVVLKQRNVVANLLQIEAVRLLDRNEKLLATLPTFHSFGFTATQWYPIFSGMKVVCLPSPLETKRLGKAIRDEQVTIMMLTPTFAKPFLKRVPAEWMETLKIVVVGAEKSPEGLHVEWEETFGGIYLEGYGLTEASPVVSCNLPSASDDAPTRRQGTVGRPLVGVEARIVDPETGEQLSINETGMLELKGPNFFEGYLDDPEKTAEVFREGWYVTGDLATIDADGFLKIEGRLSRFSKMAGEMIPHGAIEEAIIDAFGLWEEELPQVAIAGVQDEVKGEALVLLSVPDVTFPELQEMLTAKGLPNLWIPKQIVKVEAIPTLGSGKIDLKGVQGLAQGD